MPERRLPGLTPISGPRSKGDSWSPTDRRAARRGQKSAGHEAPGVSSIDRGWGRYSTDWPTSIVVVLPSPLPSEVYQDAQDAMLDRIKPRAIPPARRPRDRPRLPAGTL